MRQLFLALSFAILTFGCSSRPLPPASVLAMHVQAAELDTQRWAFQHCQLMSWSQSIDRYVPPMGPVANLSLWGTQEGEYFFACPTLPDSSRDDAETATKIWNASPRVLTCGTGAEAGKVEINEPGTGSKPSVDSFVRARVELASVVLAEDTPLFHGHVALSASERKESVTAPKGTRIPFGASMTVTQHISCFRCLSKALTQLGTNGKAHVECERGVWNISLLAIGTEDLFKSDNAIRE